MRVLESWAALNCIVIKNAGMSFGWLVGSDLIQRWSWVVSQSLVRVTRGRRTHVNTSLHRFNTNNNELQQSWCSPRYCFEPSTVYIRVQINKKKLADRKHILQNVFIIYFLPFQLTLMLIVEFESHQCKHQRLQSIEMVPNAENHKYASTIELWYLQHPLQ